MLSLKKKVSFIIPAYNSSNTIVRCLDSIYMLALEVVDFEVIVVDDCSIDDTAQIVERYSNTHSNITLLVQSENCRQGAARNRGVNIAKGKYIVFVDSDDESVFGVRDALQLAEKYNLDMVAMHYINMDEHGNILEKESIDLYGVFTGIEMQTKHPFWCTGPVPYVYKKSFLLKVNYPFEENVLFEDTDFVTIHLYYAKRMMYSAQCAYCIHYNATSTTRTTTYKHIADYLLLGTRMLNFYCSLNNKSDEYALGILEGGSYNIWKSCTQLLKLSSIVNIQEFYKRIDSFIDRTTLMGYAEPKYCWTWWTKLCLKHRFIAMFFIFIGQIGYKLKRMIK